MMIQDILSMTIRIVNTDINKKINTYNRKRASLLKGCSFSFWEEIDKFGFIEQLRTNADREKHKV